MGGVLALRPSCHAINWGWMYTVSVLISCFSEHSEGRSANL